MSTEPTKPADQILPENLTTAPDGSYLYDDEAALKLVLDDARAGDAWLNQQNWPSNWSNAYIIVQSPSSLTAFDGSAPYTSNVPKFTVSNLVDANLSKIMGGLFFENPPFLLRPRPGTSPDIVRAKTALFAYQLKEQDFEGEMEQGIHQGLLIGTQMMKWGFTAYNRKKKIFKRRAEPETHTDAAGVKRTVHTAESDAFDIVYEDEQIAHPWIKYCDRRQVIVAAGTKIGDVQKAKHVVYRDYANYDDLNILREQPGYTVPSEEVLKTFFMRERITPDGDNIAVTLPESMRGWIQTSVPRNYADSADPLANGLEILERWSKNQLIVVLRHMDDNILIYNGTNPYNRVPFLSANFRPLLDCFDGLGLATLTGSNQLVDQGITSMSLDLLSYNLNPTALRSQGLNTPGQDLVWTQGGIIDVEGDVEKAFKFLEMPPQPASAMQWLIQQQQEAKETAGANQQMTMGAGAFGAQSTGLRTGTGAAGIIAANAGRLDGYLGRIVRQIFVPWLQIMDELNNERMPTSVLRAVLDKEMNKTLQVDHIEFRSAEMEYEVLAGGKLGPKKEIQAFFPFMIQLMNNPTFSTMLNVAGYKWNVVATFKDFATAAGAKYSQDWIVKMTPEEQQKADAQLPSALGAQKAQNDKDSLVLKSQLATREEQEKELARAGGRVAVSTIEHGLTQGEAGQVLGNVEGL